MSYQTNKLNKFNEIVKLSKGFTIEKENIKTQTDELREKWKNSDENLAEALAIASVASKLAQDMEPFDTQKLCALALYDGNIAEMKTGEGKTLAAVLASILHYCNKEQVFVISVNDYLTKRDAEFATPILDLVGATCGYNISTCHIREKQESYSKDVVYVTNHEIAFDYLRNNLMLSKRDLLFKNLPHAIVDEVDSILIDEARNPFIISDKKDSMVLNIQAADKFAKELTDGLYSIDLKHNAVYLTDAGIQRAEQVFKVGNYADASFGPYRGLIQNALDANYMKTNGVDYIVKDGEIILIDLATGRLSIGKQYMNGVHQAIQAKEGVAIVPETKTTASITYQYLFKLFDGISGMTGTAMTDKEEFGAIYNLPVIEIPLRLPLARIDNPDALYVNEAERDEAVVNKIVELHKQGRPVLVGTASISKSEQISEELKKRKIKHQVLNAKQHERESEIIAKAGQKGAVTISTNMAGRGTDIVLGEGVKELGGLYVLGTERYEARRIDNQLRGRSGRQGDPGESQFFTSLDDKTIKSFGMDQLKGLLDTMAKVQDSDSIQNPAFEYIATSSQKQAEGFNFDSRKSTLKYNTLINEQYYNLYKFRNNWLIADDLTQYIEKIINKDFEDSLKGKSRNEKRELIISKEDTKKLLYNDFKNLSKERLERFRVIVLQDIDRKWTEYLQGVDYIRANAFYTAYRVTDPFTIYAEDCTKAYSELLKDIRLSIINRFNATVKEN